MNGFYRTVMAWAAALVFILATSRETSAASGDTTASPGFLGIRVKMDDGWLAVASVVDDSPAKGAGLTAGERILKIDGQSTQNKTITESVGLLTGPAGKPVTLTLLRPNAPNPQPFEVTLVRTAFKPNARFMAGGARGMKADWTRPPTKEAGPVEWKGNKIVSRVLPYPDFVSLFIRLPIAHAAALGQGVKLGAIQTLDDNQARTLILNVAPRATVELRRRGANENDSGDLAASVANAGWRVALIVDPGAWPSNDLVKLTGRLLARNVLVVVPSDLSEDESVIGAINQLETAGALTVGRVDRQSLLLPGIEGQSRGLPFNHKIADLHTDIFSTAGLDMNNPAVMAAATAAGVAALAVEKWPELSARELRRKMLAGARPAWQMVKTGAVLREIPFTVNPVTTEFKIKDDKAAFRFKALDAAGALEVDTETPWFLNMLNCKPAWEVTRGKGMRAVITDQGFHIGHPTLAQSSENRQNFGFTTFSSPEQNFHGTDMSRIFLAIAPEARIVPVLCSGKDREELTGNIAKSFRHAVEVKADVVSSSWAGWFNRDENLLAAVREAVDSGAVVSWFHYPKARSGLLRSTFTYGGGWDPEPRLGFSDRVFIDPPGFHPVEIEAGLSATAPQAAGIAALVKSVNPKLTPRQIEELLFKHATSIGGGILIPDAYKTVQAAREAK